ncbi:MAG: FtsX-like permease family protein [Deltaproteobacteria bacterium]|nr:FtsX-like permease family protein [Deltaproteobacteria bacterium]
MASELGPVLRAITRNKTAFLLVVMEVAFGFAVISSIVWVGAWYHSRGSADPGHSTQGLFSVQSLGPAESLLQAERRQQKELAALRSHNAVKEAAALSQDILDPSWINGFFVRRANGGAPLMAAWAIDGSANLADTLALTIHEGRAPRSFGNEASDEALISDNLARKLFDNAAAAVGQQLVMSDESTPITVMGVFKDARLLIPFLVNSDAVVLRVRPAATTRGSRYVVRTHAANEDEATAHALAATLRHLDPERVVVVRPYRLDTARHVNVSGGLIATLGIISVALAIVALVGNLAITAFLVQQRTRQVGIRRALGATPWDVVHYFMIENSLAVALGCVLGLAISLAYYFAFNSIFPEIHLSPWFFVFTAILFFVDGMLATLIPALRAARIPPTVASRSL